MPEMSSQVEHKVGAPPLIQSAFSRRISWGSLFAGAVVASVVQMLLTVLGVGIGAASVDAAGRATPAVGIGAGIWLAVSSIISFYCAGWAAGRLAGIPRAVESTMHGFLTWGLAMVIGMFMLTSAVSGLLGGAASIVGGAAQGAGAGAGQNPGAAAGGLSQITESVTGAVQQQGGAAGVAQQAQQAGQAAANNVAGASLASFFVMLLGAGAASLGGYVSTPKNTILSNLPAWERRGGR